jgi:hypothetical protein
MQWRLVRVIYLVLCPAAGQRTYVEMQPVTTHKKIDENIQILIDVLVTFNANYKFLIIFTLFLFINAI